MAQTVLFPVLVFAVACFHLTRAQDTYTATVMEYAKTGDPVSELTKRSQEYVDHIEKATSDIIVFPEYGLTTPYLPEDLQAVSTAVPDASAGISPCTSSQGFEKYLIDLSCAAAEHNTYVIVNLIERANSTAGTTIYYNTNVVFDPNGTVIARYRKINLCNEPRLTKGENVTTFTALNVKFGLMTGCDMLFADPALTLLDNNNNVTDIIYPHAWTSETPFLHSLTLQDGFAKANGINLLSAGYSNPSAGMGGVGIFLANASQGALDISTGVVANRQKVNVPKIVSRTPEKVCQNNLEIEPRIGGMLPDIGSFNTIAENMKLYTIKDLEISQNESRVQVCAESSELCCDFYVKFRQIVDSTSTPTYKVAAFYGTKRVNATSQTLGFGSCALLACANANADSCGQRPSSFNVSFDTITIKATLPNKAGTFYMPSTLQKDLKPIKNYAFCQNDGKDGTIGITMSGQNIDNLLTFGIFGRVYHLDGRQEGRGSATYVRATLGLTVMLLLSHFLAH